MDDLECLDGPEGCRGKITLRSTPDRSDLKAFPRCEAHFERRLDQAERNMTEYPDSPLPPAWFDPSYAGERWDEDY